MQATITTITYGGREITITTDHSASSYGQPVVTINGKLADIEVDYTPPVTPDMPSLIDQIADLANIWGGGATRRALAALVEEMYPDGLTSGADGDKVIAEFQRRGAEMRAAEEAATLG